ncbi:putative nudix hydrolase 17, mitochondrial-like isoform X1 [Capsicum annuum]|nr:putative nudix hydrolase 17, mitochondrial-like isoform X1 [Capsicum annuum]
MREFSLIWRYSVLISISCFGHLLRVEFAQFLLVQITMELEVVDVTKKRLKYSVEDNETTVTDSDVAKAVEEETAVATLVSEQVELEIANILDKINRFTNLVSELLESGKSMLKEVSNEFEERMIVIHKEQMEKWQEEIKELRLLDTSNEEADRLLLNAKYIAQNIREESGAICPML